MSGMAVELLSASRSAAAAPKKATEEAPARAEEPQPSYEPSSEYSEAPVAAVEPEPAFSGAETIESYQPAPEPVSAEPSSFLEPVSADEPAGVFEDSPAPAEQPISMGEDPPAWSPAPVDAAPAPRRRFGQDVELPVEVHGEE